MTENFAVEVATERPVSEPTPGRGEPKRITRRRLILRRFLRNKVPNFVEGDVAYSSSLDTTTSTDTSPRRSHFLRIDLRERDI